MPLILLASAAGSPGVTTTAVGLSRCWPADSLLVDADRQPSQAVLAGFLNGTPAAGRGLSALAMVHRERRPVQRELLTHCVPLGKGGTHRRLFLPGFTNPGAPALFGPVWPDLAAALARLADAGTTVVVDCGRIGDGLPGPLLAAADVVLVVTRTSLRALAGLRLHLPLLEQRIEGLGSGTQVGLLLVGQGRPYTGKEISSQFGLAVWGVVAYQPRTARVWSDGASPPGLFEHSALVRSIGATIATITSRVAAVEAVSTR